MRYLGQNYELELSVDEGDLAPDADIELLWQKFHDTHKARFGFFDQGRDHRDRELRGDRGVGRGGAGDAEAGQGDGAAGADQPAQRRFMCRGVSTCRCTTGRCCGRGMWSMAP